MWVLDSAVALLGLGHSVLHSSPSSAMVPTLEVFCKEQQGLIPELELCLTWTKNSMYFSYFCMREPELWDPDRPLTFLGLGFSSVKQRWDDIYCLHMPMKFLLNGQHAHRQTLNQSHEWLSVELTSTFRILQQLIVLVPISRKIYIDSSPVSGNNGQGGQGNHSATEEKVISWWNDPWSRKLGRKTPLPCRWGNQL